MPSKASTYRVTEPHPSVPSSHYLRCGRGGAGNHTYVDPKVITDAATATGPASRIALPQSTVYHAGRGGCGNLQIARENSSSQSSASSASSAESAIFSFDEELEFQDRLLEHQAPIYHIGRGGAGNSVLAAAGAGTTATVVRNKGGRPAVVTTMRPRRADSSSSIGSESNDEVDEVNSGRNATGSAWGKFTSFLR